MVQGMRGLDMPLATDGLCLVEESSLKIVSSDLRITGIDRFRKHLLNRLAGVQVPPPPFNIIQP